MEMINGKIQNIRTYIRVHQVRDDLEGQGCITKVQCHDAVTCGKVMALNVINMEAVDSDGGDTDIKGIEVRITLQMAR